MLKRNLPFLFSLCFSLGLLAQNTVPNMDNYQPAQSSGTLPPDVLTTTTEKYEKSRLQIDVNQSENLQKAEDDFYLQTNYAVDQILYSGTILVNDSMGMYVNRVADSLLANDPETRAKINIYILRSTVVNAFATDRGSIFVTIGLLTRLHNEAELAFVLAHEIIHYKRRHVLTGYIEGVQMQEGEGKYSATTAENRFLKRHSYARAQETQADEEGFDMLVASNYDPAAAIGAFEILAMADFPFTDEDFSKSLFEGPRFVFPSKYYTDTIKEYKISEDEEDNELATHPSVPKRKKGMKRRLAKLAAADSTGAAFLVSEQMFYRVRAMAMFEQAALHTNDGEYKEAVYVNQAVQKTWNGNYYLEKEMVRAMYAITVKKNAPFEFEDLAALFSLIFTGDFEDDDERPLGEQGRAVSFIGKTDQKGWNIASVKYAWKVHQKHPEDQDIKTWTVGLFREMTVLNELEIKDFQTNDSMFFVIGNKIMDDTALVHRMKGNDTPTQRWQVAIDKLNSDSLDGYKYWEFAFIEELKDSAFVNYFREAMAYADSLDSIGDLEDEMTSKQIKKQSEAENKAFYGPQGLTKVVVINPIYQSYDSRIKNGQLDVRKSIDGRSAMMNAMQQSAAQVGMQCEILDPENMDSTNVDKFNDLMIMNDWFAQKGNFKEGEGLPVSKVQMEAMASKYGTKYFMWMAYYTNREPRRGTVFRALSLAFVPLAPQIAYRLATPREDVYFVAILYDITTGKPVWGVQREIEKQQATDARLKLQMYDMMRMLATPKED
jgi:hypothetical protein